jgi:hypothetical protein
VGTVAFGLLARTVPQMNIFVVSAHEHRRSAVLRLSLPHPPPTGQLFNAWPATPFLSQGHDVIEFHT